MTPRTLACFVMLWPAIASAQDIEFPLGEHYRPGRFLPVRVSGDAHVAAEGAVTTHARGAGPNTIVPWLPMREGVAMTNHPMRALGESESLVGVTTDVEGIPINLLRDHTKILVRIDATRPLAGPAIAWETLDAVVLDRAAARLVDPATIATLRAAGTVVVIASEPLAAEQSPIIGPRGAVIAPAAYRTAQAWNPGHDDATRRLVVLLGVAIGIVATAVVLLLRPPAVALAALAAFSIVVMIGLAPWRQRLPAVHQARATVVVRHADFVQIDRWTYLRAARSTADVRWPLAGVTHPIFEGPEDVKDLQMRVDVSPGALEFRLHLPQDRTIAFLTRELAPIDTRIPESDVASASLSELYVRPDVRVATDAPQTRTLVLDAFSESQR